MACQAPWQHTPGGHDAAWSSAKDGDGCGHGPWGYNGHSEHRVIPPISGNFNGEGGGEPRGAGDVCWADPKG